MSWGWNPHAWRLSPRQTARETPPRCTVRAYSFLSLSSIPTVVRRAAGPGAVSGVWLLQHSCFTDARVAFRTRTYSFVGERHTFFCLVTTYEWDCWVFFFLFLKFLLG